MGLSLTDILKLVGSLDDTPGENTARERFRIYLAESVKAVSALRDYIETCLRTSGPQYSRALQDLVNHCGRLLGFQVEFGSYQGTPGEVGHDGLWQSPAGYSIVVEAKTTDAYPIRTATLLNYINGLVSEKRIPDRDQALGLYVVGRIDANLSQLTGSIIAERLTQQLRVISTDSLLSLAELMESYDVTHEEVLGLLRPGGPVVDQMVKLLARVASQEEVETVHQEVETAPTSAAASVTARGVGLEEMTSSTIP